MSPAVTVMLFLVVLGLLARLLSWEYRRVRKPPGISPEALRCQLDGPALPYTPPPERRTRSMDRLRTT
jgi:hypothetical protein